MTVASKSRRSPKKGGTRRVKPWEPSTRDLEIYRMICDGRKTHTEISEEFKGIGRQTVSKVGRKIDDWLAPQLMESIRVIKARHTQHLMVIFREAMNAWDCSKCVDTKVAVSEGDGQYMTTTTQQSHVGNPAFLTQARQALAEIRGIWGADAPIEVRHGLEIRVAGRDMEDAAKDVLNQMEIARKRIIDVTGG